MDLRDKRIDYDRFHLTEEEAGNDPFELFKRWYSEASKEEIEANIMVVSTSVNNQPDSRIVLLKEVFEQEFVFYTNYTSHKGEQIANNPNVSLLFFWQNHQRQVRVTGTAQKVSAKQSDEYFASRPYESQIGAIASQQSSELATRGELGALVNELLEKHRDTPVKRPDHWGGYRVAPSHFEFWQGRPSRLHDRICFTKKGDHWNRGRLHP